jgi:formylmethanofuran--tetrahydromethanopterin N-formyltransferase
LEINGVLIDDTFAEAFPCWCSMAVITAVTKTWAHKIALEATGFATSCIGCAAEAGIDYYVPTDKTPDWRPGYAVMVCNPSKKKLKEQMIERIAECVLTAPTAAVFNGLPNAEEKIPVKLHFFGDGYERQVKVGERDCWAIPIMAGEFLCEEEYGIVKGVAGGNFLIMSDNQMSALIGAEAAVEAIDELEGAITSFPGGIVASGSKVGSHKYKFMNASTNEEYAPTIRDRVPNTKIPSGINAVFEVVIDGLDIHYVKKAMMEGIEAACGVPGVKRISAGNYGGKLGPHQIHLHDLFKT